MKKIICGVIALLFGIVALNAETIDNKSTQNNTIFKYNKKSFFFFTDKDGKDVTDKHITKEVLDSIEFKLDDSNNDMEMVDKGDYIEIKKKGSPSDSK